jgi:hypothetical protein
MSTCFSKKVKNFLYFFKIFFIFLLYIEINTKNTYDTIEILNVFGLGVKKTPSSLHP